MDTFIVRIYRRIAPSTEEPVGTVEHVESGERVGFCSVRQLLSKLLTHRRRDGDTGEEAVVPASGGDPPPRGDDGNGRT